MPTETAHLCLRIVIINIVNYGVVIITGRLSSLAESAVLLYMNGSLLARNPVRHDNQRRRSSALCVCADRINSAPQPLGICQRSAAIAN